MAKFIKKKNGSLLNIISLQSVKIDSEDDKKLILYRVNGQFIIEEYENSSKALEAYNTYKTAMTDSEGGSSKELKRRIAELSDQVVEQQGQISNLETEISDLETENETLEGQITDLNTELNTATNLSDEILNGSSGNILNVYTQLTEPENKNGIWLQTDQIEDANITADINVASYEKWNINKALDMASLPYSFDYTRCVTIGNDMYIFGGKGVNSVNAYKYNFLTNNFIQITNVPYNFLYGSVVAVGTNVFLFGGSYNGAGSTTAYKYDTLTDTYTQLTDIPFSFYSSDAASVGTDIYLLGSQGSRKTAYKYDTLTDVYTQLTDIPYGFYDGVVASVGTNIYLFFTSGYTYKYDILTDTYTKLANSPGYNSEGFVGISVGTNIYLFIGRNFNEAYKYNTLTNTYTFISNTPSKHGSGPAVAYLGHDIYYLGGYNATSKDILCIEENIYEDNTIVLSQGKHNSFNTKIIDNSNNIKVGFNDVFYYTTENGLDDTIPTYCGDGAQWIELT